MIIERTMHDKWLSNSWLVGDRPGGHAVLVDAGGPRGPIEDALRRHGLTLTHVLCTHHHPDHVAHAAAYADDHGVPICGHEAERELFGRLDEALEDGAEVASGALAVRALHIPGHTTGQLAFVVDDARVFTGDTLFRGSVGGTRGPGHGTFEQLRASVMDVLMALPHDMPVHPGHVDETTIGAEWEGNPFVRAWRGADVLTERACTAFGERASLLVDAPDYDGGRKCWVRFEDGRLDVVPGSQVKRNG